MKFCAVSSPRPAPFEVARRASGLLSPLQLGVGVKNGCEAVVHALNSVIDDPAIVPEEKCVLQIDFQNAFNLIDREEVFRQVRLVFPELAAWVEASYGIRALLNFGVNTILSCVGVHQGDPLGVLLFCLALHPLISRLRDIAPDLKMNSWFADDGTAVGRVASLAAVHDFLLAEGPAVGLYLSSAKSVIWCADLPFSEDPLHRGVPRAPAEGMELLGAPVGSASLVKEVLDKRVAKIEEVVSKIHILEDPQAEYALLRSCLSLPKFRYAARTTHPCLHASSMRRFDGLMREALGGVVGHPLDDSQWSQASLPVSMGGLGFRSASLHSSPSFVNSLGHSVPLVSSILSPSVYAPNFVDALALVNQVVDDPVTFDEVQKLSMKQLTHAVDHRLQRLVLAAADGVQERARLSCVTKKHAGDWLNVVPSYGLNTTLHPLEFRCAALYRLGAPIFEKDAPCPACGRPSDRFGHHAIACGVHGERISRHNEVCNIIFRTAQKAGLGPSREFRGLIPGSAARPADIFLRSWNRGSDAALDVTVISPLQLAVVDREAVEPGYALRFAWDRKMRAASDACAAQRISFIPLPVETFGGWHPDAALQITRIGRELARSPSGADHKTVIKHFFQRLGLALQKGNAALILSRSTDIPCADLIGIH